MMGMTCAPNPAIVLRTNMNGMGRWIYKNHLMENFFALTLKYPNGRFKIKANNVNIASNPAVFQLIITDKVTDKS